MTGSLLKIGHWMKRRAENVAVALLATVFISFILQIVFRYVLNWPVGWTLEVSTLAWMWLVLWGAAFVVTEPEEIRFDIVYTLVRNRMRCGFTIVASLALAILLAVSLPATIAYVKFMRIEHASYIDVRLDYLFSIYILFAVATICRHLWRAFHALRGMPSEMTDAARLRDE